MVDKSNNLPLNFDSDDDAPMFGGSNSGTSSVHLFPDDDSRPSDREIFLRSPVSDDDDDPNLILMTKKPPRAPKTVVQITIEDEEEKHSEEDEDLSLDQPLLANTDGQFQQKASEMLPARSQPVKRKHKSKRKNILDSDEAYRRDPEIEDDVQKIVAARRKGVISSDLRTLSLDQAGEINFHVDAAFDEMETKLKINEVNLLATWNRTTKGMAFVFLCMFVYLTVVFGRDSELFTGGLDVFAKMGNALIDPDFAKPDSALMKSSAVVATLFFTKLVCSSSCCTDKNDTENSQEHQPSRLER